MAIRFKILLGCLGFIVLTIAFGAFVRTQEQQLGTLATDVYDNALVAMTYAQTTQTDFVRLAEAERRTPKPFSTPAARAQLDLVLQDLDVAVSQAISAKGKRAAERVRGEIVTLPKTPPAQLAARLDTVDADLGKLVRRFHADSFVYRVKVDKIVEGTRSWFIVAIVAAGLLALMITVLLGQAIVPPINHAVSIASSIAEGKLDNQIASAGRSETARLLQALKTMQDSIVESVRRAEALRRAETARVTAEYESEIAHQASRAKSEFLATMSHELRTPLNAILGFSEVIQHQMFGPVSAQYAGYAKDIHVSGMHLLDLINDVLDLSKLEAGKVDMKEETVSLGDLVEECATLVRDQAILAGVPLTLDIDATLLVVADRRHVKQVVLNLLSNALKFTPRERGVSVRTRVHTVVELEIADGGIGMTADEIKIALSPFGQVDSKIARQHKGTGLGLPISRNLMQLHGGDLRLESEPGRGTRAIAVFPLERVVVIEDKATG